MNLFKTHQVNNAACLWQNRSHEACTSGVKKTATNKVVQLSSTRSAHNKRELSLYHETC